MEGVHADYSTCQSVCLSKAGIILSVLRRLLPATTGQVFPPKIQPSIRLLEPGKHYPCRLALGNHPAPTPGIDDEGEYKRGYFMQLPAGRIKMKKAVCGLFYTKHGFQRRRAMTHATVQQARFSASCSKQSRWVNPDR